MQSPDPGLGRSGSSMENASQIKNKRRRDSIVNQEPQKKKKTIQRNLVDELFDKVKVFAKKQQFQNFEINGNALNFDINPDQKVYANVNIWNAKELFVRVTFEDRREIVEIVDESFEKLTTKLKIERLRNISDNIKRITSRKEEMFPGVLNWESFVKSNYEI